MGFYELKEAKRYRSRTRSFGFNISKRFWIISGGVLLLAGLFFLMFFFMSGDDIRPSYSYYSNTLAIEWEKPENVESVYVYTYSEDGTEIELGNYTDPYAIVNDVQLGKPLTIKYEIVQKRKLFGLFDLAIFHNRIKETINPIELIPPELETELESGLDSQSVKVKWPIEGEGDIYLYYLDKNNNWTAVEIDKMGRKSFEIGKDVEFPDTEHPISFRARTSKMVDGIVFYSAYGSVAEIKRSDLMPKDIILECKRDDEGKYVFTFNESVKDTYELQQMDATSSKKYETLETFKVDGTIKENVFKYVLDWLPSGTELSFRVIAYNEDEPDKKIKSEEKKVVGETTSNYCTIWPVANLKVYDSAESSNKIANIDVGECYSVIEESNGRFKILLKNGQYGYVDTRYCMINLPEFLGNMCQYDIRNAYASNFTVHGNEIPELTGKLVNGYENINIEDTSKTFVVPYLYPSACKLADVAAKVIKDGYILKIYDAFIPKVGTEYINDRILSSLELEITSEGMESVAGTRYEDELRYYDELTANSYGPSDFYGKTNDHNLGTAIDISLVNKETGKELDMQTSVHDISSYSVIVNNNENATKLNQYMTDFGFKGSVTKWWEFNDEEIRGNIELKANISEGLSLEGFKKSKYGWKYQKANGSFAKDESIIVEGKIYKFDELGYCMEDM